MKMLGGIPSTWDETIIPDASVGEYIITARRKGKDWYIAAMTNWDQRKIKLSLAFLPPGRYKFEQCIDGINADRYPSDYRITNGELNNKDTIQLTMAQGGGYFIHLTRL